MRFSLLKHFRGFKLEEPDAVALRDADDLIKQWGDAAYDRATYLSWEEDTAHIRTPQPGHWWRVRREIGRRFDIQSREPRAEFSPRGFSAPIHLS